MKILVIGSGGREHAIALKVAESDKAEKIYAVPGNPGMAEVAECHSVDIMDNEAMVAFAKKKAIDLVIVGPENPLANGIVDAFEDAGIKSFGPKEKATEFEASKAFTRKFIEKYELPGAEFKEFTDFEEARAYIEERGAPIVVKTDGLAAGKGAFVAETIETAVTFAEDCLIGKKFGEASSKIIVEECLVGEEVSYLVFTDGKTFKPMVYSQDHKQIYEGDNGPNTGGMGAYSPASLLRGKEDFLRKEISLQKEEIWYLDSKDKHDSLLKELRSANALLEQEDESINSHDLIHKLTKVLDLVANQNVIGSALGIIATGSF